MHDTTCKRLARDLAPIRYAADQDTLQSLRRALADNPDHWAPGSNLRLIAADAHDENDQPIAAAHLRSDRPIIGFHHAQTWVQHPNGTHYTIDTHPEVISALEQARQSGNTVHVSYGDPVTGRDSLDDYGVKGRIGRSMGWIKTPTIVATTRSMGGHSVLSGIVVKVHDTKTGRTLYQHPNYHVGTIEFKPSPHEGYPFGVYRDGENVANFRTALAAKRWATKLGIKLPEYIAPSTEPEKLSRRISSALSRIRYAAGLSPDLTVILQALRRDPHDDVTLGAFADAYSEHHGDGTDFLSRYLPEYANGSRSNVWYSPVDLANPDFSEHVPLGVHNGFRYWVGTEGRTGQSPRFIVHAEEFRPLRVRRSLPLTFSIELHTDEVTHDVLDSLPSDPDGVSIHDVVTDPARATDQLRAYQDRVGDSIRRDAMHSELRSSEFTPH